LVGKFTTDVKVLDGRFCRLFDEQLLLRARDRLRQYRYPDLSCLSVVVTFAFSRPVLVKCFADRFQGEWKYLWKACCDIPEQRANRALLELALQLRLIDDREHVTKYFKTTDEYQRVGKIIKQDGTEDKLRSRDLTNRILHSSGIEWGF
jgi:hypothetical protein